LILENDEIVALLEQYNRESKAIKEEALRFTWYMRGGLSYNEAVALGPQERDMVSKIIDSNIKATEKTGLPLI
jgi:hypothetical protein